MGMRKENRRGNSGKLDRLEATTLDARVPEQLEHKRSFERPSAQVQPDWQNAEQLLWGLPSEQASVVRHPAPAMRRSGGAGQAKRSCEQAFTTLSPLFLESGCHAY